MRTPLEHSILLLLLLLNTQRFYSLCISLHRHKFLWKTKRTELRSLWKYLAVYECWTNLKQRIIPKNGLRKRWKVSGRFITSPDFRTLHSAVLLSLALQGFTWQPYWFFRFYEIVAFSDMIPYQLYENPTDGFNRVKRTDKLAWCYISLSFRIK
jgi:hypothetical protein